MDDLRDLYQELILDHGKSPRNFRYPEGANREANGHNPLCGDQLTVKVRYEEGVVVDVGFQGSGCAISQAAASTMTEWAKGRRREEVAAMFHDYHDAVTGKAEPDDDKLGKLVAFAGVREFPMRVKCATLAWHTLEAALEGSGEVTTE